MTFQHFVVNIEWEKMKTQNITLVIILFFGWDSLTKTLAGQVFAAVVSFLSIAEYIHCEYNRRQKLPRERKRNGRRDR